MTTDIQLLELLEQSKTFKGLSISERISSLESEQESLLTYLSVINEHLDMNEISEFYSLCEYEVSHNILKSFIEKSIRHLLLVPRMIEGEHVPLFQVADKVKEQILRNITQDEQRKLHEYADMFYAHGFLSALKDLYQEYGIEIESDEKLLEEVLLPNGLIDFGAHHSQSSLFHDWVVAKAYYWNHHLYALEKYEDAFNLTNSIVFSVARKGKKNIAKEMLLRNISILSGKDRTISLINYATILREDQDFRNALKIYRRTIIPSIWQKSPHQLSGIFSEMSNIQRDKKQTLRAIIFQHISKLIRIITREERGIAICNNQLSILYRTYRKYRKSLRLSKAAERYWRSIGDEVNLAKTVLTQGNIFNHMKKPQKALSCFEESETLNRNLKSFGELASAISGKARAMLQLKDYDNAKKYLDEAISLRERYHDKRVGIEYENMGQLLEIQGKYALAQGWYKKALKNFEQYQPSYVSHCRNKINLMKKRMR